MASFIACYLTVWIAVVIYLAHLGAAQRRMRQDLEQLQKQLDRRPAEQPSSARAA